MDELLDIATIAAYLGVSERTVYNKVRSGELPALKVGRLWRVRAADLDAWLRRSPAGGRSPRESGPPGGASLTAEGGRVPTRADLEAALDGVTDQLERRLLFIGLLSRAYEALGWPAPVIVGGHAVEFWTAGGYTTVDIDLVSASEPFGQTLSSWGFAHQGRHFYDDSLGLVVEAPGAQLTADERARVVAVRLRDFTVLVLGLEDLIIDRLNACVHWSHEESCDVARALVLGGSEVDWAYLRRRADEEGLSDTLGEVLEGVDLP